MHRQYKRVYCLVLSMKLMNHPHLSAEVLSPRAATLAIPTSHRSSAESGLHNLSDSFFQACMHEHTCSSDILPRKCWCTLMVSTFYGASQPNQKSGATVECCLKAHVNLKDKCKKPWLWKMQTWSRRASTSFAVCAVETGVCGLPWTNQRR